MNGYRWTVEILDVETGETLYPTARTNVASVLFTRSAGVARVYPNRAEARRAAREITTASEGRYLADAAPVAAGR